MLSRGVRLVALALAALVLAGGVATWCGTSPRAVAADGSDTKVKALLKERHATLEMAAQVTSEDYKHAKVSFRQVEEANRAVLNAELDLCETDKERAAVLEKMLAEARNYERIVEEVRNAARASYADVLKARADRLQVEITLERARAR
jgi:hypothetical protein